MTRFVLACLAALTLSGCDMLGRMMPAPQPAPMRADVLMWRENAAQPIPLQQVALRAGVRSLHGPRGVGVALRDGVLIQTRGLPGDLMSSDTAAAERALRTGDTGRYERFYTTLDARGDTRFHTLRCRISARDASSLQIDGRSRAVQRIEETCVTPGARIINSYWRDGAGRILRSRQWANEQIGYLVFERAAR